MNRHSVNTVAVLLAAAVVLAASLIFASACADLVHELRVMNRWTGELLGRFGQ